ncbi:MAG TPA: hypothetical protein VGK39_08280, partial [Cyclobacteriaceae bacterium]
MEQTIKLLTYTHVFAGIISLIVAPIAMVVEKGGSAHRLWGKVFFWCMTWICITAVVMSAYNWNPFLLLIAVFSYYSVFIGYRSLYMKQLHKGKSVRWFDWVATVLAGLFNVGFFIWGIMSINKDNLTFGILAAGFGYGGLMQVRSQIKNFVKPPTDKHQWFYNHIGNMIGGFIASVTAFSANVLTFMPGIFQWL